MSIVLYLRDRNAITLKMLGLIYAEDFRKITDIAYNLNLRCLPFIDVVGDTILNHKQTLELIKEIAFLRTQKTEINEEHLNILHTSALAVFDHADYYLLLNGN